MNVYSIKIRFYSLFQKLLGRELVKKTEIKLYSKIVRERGIHFFHIPKSAGTSICYLLYGRRIGHSSYQEIIKIKGQDYLNNLNTFTVVRKPLERLISSYQFALSGSESGDAKRRKYYSSDDRFRCFDSFIQEWLVYEDLSTIDIIFRPQHKFVSDKNGCVQLDKVFKIEDQRLIETYLQSVLDEEVQLPHANKTKKTKKNIEVSKESKNIIKGLYRLDFEKFGY